MKLFIVLLLCIAVVLGSPKKEKLDNMLKDASNACVQEMDLGKRFIIDKGPPSDPCLTNDPKFITCLNKKMGVMNEDGSFNKDHILALFTESAESKEFTENAIKTKMEKCSSKIGDACKVVACAYKLSEELCGRKVTEDDGC